MTAPTLPPSQVEALTKGVYPDLTAGNAESLAYDLETRGRDWTIGPEATAAYLRGAASCIRSLAKASDALLTDRTADRARIAALEEDAKRWRTLAPRLYVECIGPGDPGHFLSSIILDDETNPLPTTAEEFVARLIARDTAPTPEPTPTERTTDE